MSPLSASNDSCRHVNKRLKTSEDDDDDHVDHEEVVLVSSNSTESHDDNSDAVDEQDDSSEAEDGEILEDDEPLFHKPAAAAESHDDNSDVVDEQDDSSEAEDGEILEDDEPLFHKPAAAADSHDDDNSDAVDDQDDSSDAEDGEILEDDEPLFHKPTAAAAASAAASSSSHAEAPPVPAEEEPSSNLLVVPCAAAAPPPPPPAAASSSPNGLNASTDHHRRRHIHYRQNRCSFDQPTRGGAMLTECEQFQFTSHRQRDEVYGETTCNDQGRYLPLDHADGIPLVTIHATDRVRDRGLCFETTLEIAKNGVPSPRRWDDSYTRVGIGRRGMPQKVALGWFNGSILTSFDVPIPPVRLDEFTWTVKYVHGKGNIGGGLRQAASILVRKIVDGDYVGLDRNDIKRMQDIVPTVQETNDWAIANNGFRDEKEDAGNPGTDWMDALRDQNVQNLHGLLTRMRQML
jgi:hypothetical protein